MLNDSCEICWLRGLSKCFGTKEEVSDESLRKIQEKIEAFSFEKKN